MGRTCWQRAAPRQDLSTSSGRVAQDRLAADSILNVVMGSPNFEILYSMLYALCSMPFLRHGRRIASGGCLSFHTGGGENTLRLP